MKNRFLFAFGVVSCLAALAHEVRAGTTWDGGGGDDFWGTGNNWNDNVAPGLNSAITFAGSTRLTPDWNYGDYNNMNQLLFASGASGFTLGSSLSRSMKLTVNGGSGIKIENNSTTPQTIANTIPNLVYDASGELNPTAGDLTINSTIFMDNGGQLRVYGPNSKILTLNGNVSAGSGSGHSFALLQNSIVVMNSTMNLAGGNFMNAGELRLGSSGSINGTINIGDTGGSENAKLSATTSGQTIGNTLNIRSGNSGTMTIGGINTSGTATFSGGVTLNKAATLSAASGGTVAFSGAFSGNQALTVTGPGTVRLNGGSANDFNGVTTSSGILELNKTAGVDAIDAGTHSIGANATNTLLAANQINDSADIAANGTLDLNSNTETFDELSGAGSVSQGSAQLIVGNNNGSSTFAGTLTGTGDFVKKGTGTLQLSGANTVSGSIFPVAGTLQFDAAQGSGFAGSGIWLGETGGSDSATVAIGTGGVTVTNRITVRAGSSGTKTISALNNSGTATFSGPVVMNSSVTLAKNSSGQMTMSGNIDTQGSNLTVNTAGGIINLNGIVSGTNGKLIKQGTGGVVLAATNTYTGNTEIDLGPLLVTGDINSGSTTYIGNGASGGNATLALSASGVNLGGVVQVNTDPGAGTRNIQSGAASGNTELSGLVRLARNVTIDATSGSTLTFSGGLKLDFSGENDATIYGDVTISSLIDVTSGASDITHMGSGILTISGNNSGELFKLNIIGDEVRLDHANALGSCYADKINFTGASGILRVGATMAPASLGMTLNGVNATISVDPGVTFTVPGAVNAISGTPTVGLSDTGTLAFSGPAANNDVNVSVADGVFAGNGISGTLLVTVDGRIAPGSSPGTMDAGNTTWAPTGGYTWEINDFNGTYGGDPGLDKLNVTGTLTIGATSGNPFTIYVTSLNGSSPGDAANFDNTQTYTRKIASASTSISGFAANKFVVDTNGFSNAAGGGTWAIQQTGTDIELVFTPPFVIPTTNSATWDGGDSADAYWQSWTNWNGDARPATGGAATLNFAGSTRLVNTNDYTPGQQFNDLYFTVGAAAFTLRGASLSISNKIENNSVNAQTIENALTLNGPASTEVNPVAGDLTLAGATTVNNADLIVYSDDGASGNAVRFNNTVSQGIGSSKLIVRQNATVEIAAANTLSDDIEIDRGAVHIEAGGSVAAGTAWIGNGTMIASNAAFVITDADGGTTVARTMNINDGTAGNRTLGGANASGVNTFSGNIGRGGGADKTLTLTAAAGGVVDYTGLLDGDDNVLVTGGGTTRFSAPAKTYTGDTVLSGSSTLQLNGVNLIADTSDVDVGLGSTFDLNNNTETVQSIAGSGNIALGSALFIVDHTTSPSFSGVMSGTGSFVKKGTGTLPLGGANSYNGQTYIVGGTLRYDVAQAGGFTGILNVGGTGGDPNGDSTLAIGTGGVTLSNPITVRTGTLGTRTIRASNAAGTATFGGAVTMNHALTLAASGGGALDISAGGINQNANQITVENLNDVTIGAVTGSGAIEKAGGFLGTLIVAGDVSSGDIRHNDGKIRVASGGDISGASVYYLGSDVIAFQYDTTLELAANGIDIGRMIEVEDPTGTAAQTIRSTVAGTQTLSGTVRLDDQGVDDHELIVSATNGSTIVLSGTVDLDYDASNDLRTRGPGDITISGQLNAASGAANLITEGSGVVTVSGDNSGQLFQIEHGGGTVYLNSANALGTSYLDKIRINASGATTRVGVTMGPASLGILFTGNYTHTIQVDSGVTFTVPNTINDDVFTGDLIKTGAGDLTVQAVNTLDGTVTVSGGTLHVSSGASFGTTSVSAGGYLKGGGTVGTLSVSGIVAPGASVGTLNAGATTFAPGGTNVWEINDFSGTYGSATGWDKLNVTGLLNITATAGNPFTIDVTSLNGSSPGSAASFTNTQGYTNKIATASGGVNLFASNKFSVVSGNFANAMNGGTWVIQQTGNDLELVFAPNAGLAPATVIMFK